MNGDYDISRLLLETLKRAGVQELFGIPGDFVLPLFKTIEESAILPLYTLSHEPAVGFAADGASRLACRPSAAVVTYGAGALNLVNPIAAAYAERVPVIVVSGGPGVYEQHNQLLLHHQAKRLDSQFEIYREITCAQTRLKDPVAAPGELSRVVSEAIRQSRPAYIEVPRDCVTTQCGPPQPLQLEMACDEQALATCVDEVQKVLEQANSPMLMVGVEIRRLGIETDVVRLAELLQIPVVTSFMGRGLLANRGLNLYGTYMGIAGDQHLSDMVENADALFLLGVIPSDTNLGTSRKTLNLKQCILAQDGAVSLQYHTYPDIPLPALVQSLLLRLANRENPAREVATRLPSVKCPRGLARDEEEVVPDDIARGVNDALAQGWSGPIVADVGDSMFVAMDLEDTALAAPGYYASMGYAVPAGLGIQAATGKRPLIIVGDGAFQMTGWELGNCRRYGWDPIVIVLNNCGWEMLRAFQPESRFNDLDCWELAELGRGLGGTAIRVRTRRQLSEALAQAFRNRGSFQLIEVMVPRGHMSRNMAQFVAGIGKKRELASH